MLLEVQHVRKEFQNRTLALTDASFSVSQGDFVSSTVLFAVTAVPFW